MSQIRFDEEVSNQFSMHYISSRISYNPIKYIDYVPDISGYVYIYIYVYIQRWLWGPITQLIGVYTYIHKSNLNSTPKY